MWICVDTHNDKIWVIFLNWEDIKLKRMYSIFYSSYTAVLHTL